MNIKLKLAELPESKIYFSIGDVAKFCNLEASVIRYWQKEFKQLNPKISNNQRRYQKKNIALILEIKHLLYEEKLTIQGAIKRLNNKSKEIPNNNTDNSHQVRIKQELENILKIIQQ